MGSHGHPALDAAAGASPPTRGRRDWGPRFILATRSLDRGYRLMDRLRSELVLAFASDETLDRFNDLAYSHSTEYDPGSSAYRASLFPWEESVIERFFPQPPARVLIGGAGSGREAFALLELGYEVVAFEPSVGLLRSMTDRVRTDTGLRAYRAGFEDLPSLAPAVPGQEATSLERMAP